ncbi:MAG: hypothetical protein QCI38_07015 [Candidatus Thermoplasmatota archaeon]|nr:hypothetical protein [Candidatus Thermoplasmatota archaeon]
MPRHAKKDETDTCAVEGCGSPAKKSLSRKKVADSLTSSLAPGGRNVHLCQEHYKDYKKATKDERKLERLDW